MPFNPNMRVLVVDDFATMRRIVRNILRQIGLVNVVEADDGTTAWEVLNREKIDFIVSDWNMPKMAGIDLLRKVRASEQFANTPFELHCQAFYSRYTETKNRQNFPLDLAFVFLSQYAFCWRNLPLRMRGIPHVTE